MTDLEPSRHSLQQLILDTDIGDDIDDAMALALIMASPELQLVGVTTVFGNVLARSRQARTLLTAGGSRFAKIPVSVGCSRGITTVRHDGLMSAFSDRNRLPNQDGTCLAESELPKLDPRLGVDFLIETILSGDGNIIPVLIGAMTNFALAIVKEPRIVERVPRLLVMAGEFRRPMAEWNIRCDPEAAAIVFSSGIPIDLIPWHVGDVVQLTPEEVAQMNASDKPVCRRLSAAIQAWQSDRLSDAQAVAWPPPRLYDPMTIATLLRPDLCTWKTGNVRVQLSNGPTFAHTTFDEHVEGKHRVAWEADRAASVSFFLDRVLRF